MDKELELELEKMRKSLGVKELFVRDDLETKKQKAIDNVSNE